MRTGPVALVALLVSSGVASAERFAVKPGAWEMQVTTTTTGDVMSPEAKAKMSPDNRAMVDKLLSDRSGQPTSMTRRGCIRKADLDADRFLAGRSDCTTRTVEKSATRLVLARTCRGDPPSEGTVTFDARSPEAVVGVIEQQRGAEGKVRIEVDGKWLGASCAGIETTPRLTR